MKPTWLHYPATGIVKGDPVYYAYQATFKDPKTGSPYCLIAGTKEDCMRLAKLAFPDMVIKEEWVLPIAIMQPSSVKVSGGLVPYASISDAGRIIPATEPTGPRVAPTPVVDEEDDLI